MKFQNLSVKRLFSRVAMGLALSMSGITIALFLVTKQIAVLLTGGALLLCALVGIFVLTQAFGKRLSQFTADPDPWAAFGKAVGYRRAVCGRTHPDNLHQPYSQQD